jgi:hypothetical protein
MFRCDYYIDHIRSVIEIEWFRPPDAEEFGLLLHGLVEHVDYHEDLNLLFIDHGTEFCPPIDTLRRGILFFENRREFPGRRIAIVMLSLLQIGLDNILHCLADSDGPVIRTFRDTEQARQWLADESRE